jgi:hypothetical protein
MYLTVEGRPCALKKMPIWSFMNSPIGGSFLFPLASDGSITREAVTRQSVVTCRPDGASSYQLCDRRQLLLPLASAPTHMSVPRQPTLSPPIRSTRPRFTPMTIHDLHFFPQDAHSNRDISPPSPVDHHAAPFCPLPPWYTPFPERYLSRRTAPVAPRRRPRPPPPRRALSPSPAAPGAAGNLRATPNASGRYTRTPLSQIIRYT